MIRVADLFCGAGGETCGIVQALAGERYDLAVVNHWDLAIETHKRNHPQARHFLKDLSQLNPHDVFEPRARLDLLWASPECTHYSVARGGRPRSDQFRASPVLILKWLSDLYVRHVIVENVPEFTSWGPLDANGRPLKSRRGETFNAWVEMIRSLGYRVEWQMLCAADYGDPTTRTRFFLQAVRGRGRIEWPAPTHSREPDLFGLKPWVPARDIIDWSIPGQSIFGRKKPLAATTMRRIEAGIRRYWGEWAEPFLVPFYGERRGQEARTHCVEEPVPTIPATGGGKFGLVMSFLTRFNGNHPGKNDGDTRNYSTDRPIGTLDASPRYGLIQPFILHQATPGRPREVSEPMPTVTSINGHRLVEPFLVQYNGTADVRPIRIPLGCLTTKDRFALVNGQPLTLDITLRMLTPRELARAQGFADDYWFAGKQLDQVKQIGNAVPVHESKALVLSAMEAA